MWYLISRVGFGGPDFGLKYFLSRGLRVYNRLGVILGLGVFSLWSVKVYDRLGEIYSGRFVWVEFFLSIKI